MKHHQSIDKGSIVLGPHDLPVDALQIKMSNVEFTVSAVANHFSIWS